MPIQTTSSSLRVVKTLLPGVLVLEPRVLRDERGFFLESYNQAAMSEAGITQPFVQDNHSSSVRNTLRGLHYQICQPQGKLIRVVSGEIFDVAVDLRRSSSTFGKWFGIHLSAENHLMIWLPQGMAHGFNVLSQAADVLYKSTAFYAPQCERTIAWDDADLGIVWRLAGDPIISSKDAKGVSWHDAEAFE